MPFEQLCPTDRAFGKTGILEKNGQKREVPAVKVKSPLTVGASVASALLAIAVEDLFFRYIIMI
jgi:hypothetical protein